MSLLRLFYLLLSAHVVSAQVAETKLENDPVFTTILSRRITYPAHAEHLGIYAKLYAGFHIDQRGHLQQISILNPSKIGYGFEEEVIKKLKLIPPLNPGYEGAYALPVGFAIVDYTNGAKMISASGRLSDGYFKDRILLKEIIVVGRKAPKQKGDELAPYSKGTVRATDR